LENIGALLPIALGPVRARARHATAAGGIVAVLVVVLGLTQLLVVQPLSAHIS